MNENPLVRRQGDFFIFRRPIFPDMERTKLQEIGKRLEAIYTLLAALALDILFGEPPNRFHPVVLMGRLTAACTGPAGGRSPRTQFLIGAASTAVLSGTFAAGSYLLLSFLATVNTVLSVLTGAILLKMTFSFRMLRTTALHIRKLLSTDRTDESRFELRALVSRNTADLTDSQLASAAIESVGESTGDSFVAPLFYFLLFGVPGALAYRMVNTMDSMIGYRGEYEHTGKFAAILDDVLNYIPARLAAVCLVLAGSLTRRSGKSAWKTARSDRKRTSSPNAGWPMAAMAGALGTRLEKPGEYVLGEKGTAPSAITIGDSVRVMEAAFAIWTILCLSAGGAYHAFATPA